MRIRHASAVVIGVVALFATACAASIDEQALVAELVSDQGFSPADARCIVDLVSDQVDADVLVGEEAISDEDELTLAEAVESCSGSQPIEGAGAVVVDEATVLGLAVTIEDMRIEAIAALVSDQRYGYSGRQAECVVDELVERQGEQFLRELATVLSDSDFQEAAEATFDVCA